MVAHTLILEGAMRTVTFNTDKMKVWGLISAITRHLDCWTYGKSAQRTRYGINAYHELWDHLLGPDNLDNMAIEAESLLVVTHYSGEHKLFDFERYMKIQEYQHHILEGIK